MLPGNEDRIVFRIPARRISVGMPRKASRLLCVIPYDLADLQIPPDYMEVAVSEEITAVSDILIHSSDPLHCMKPPEKQEKVSGLNTNRII